MYLIVSREKRNDSLKQESLIIKCFEQMCVQDLGKSVQKSRCPNPSVKKL